MITLREKYLPINKITDRRLQYRHRRKFVDNILVHTLHNQSLPIGYRQALRRFTSQPLHTAKVTRTLDKVSIATRSAQTPNR